MFPIERKQKRSLARALSRGMKMTLWHHKALWKDNAIGTAVVKAEELENKAEVCACVRVSWCDMYTQCVCLNDDFQLFAQWYGACVSRCVVRIMLPMHVQYQQHTLLIFCFDRFVRLSVFTTAARSSVRKWKLQFDFGSR